MRFVRAPGKGYPGVSSRARSRLLELYGSKNVAKTPQNIHPNHPFDKVITNNHSVLSEI